MSSDGVRAAPAMTTSNRWWLWYLALNAVIVPAGALLPTVVGPLFLALDVSVLVAVLVGMRLHRRGSRLPWLLIVAGTMMPLLANGTRIVGGALGWHFGYPDLLDAVYMMLYPLIAAGFLALPGRGTSRLLGRGLLEAGILACAGLVLVWTLLVDPLYERADQIRHAANLASMAYPVVDLLILSAAVRLLLTTGRRSSWHVLIVASTAALTAGDLGFVTHVAGGGDGRGAGLGLLLCWQVAVSLLGVVVLHPRMAGAPAAENDPAESYPRAMFVVYGLIVTVCPAAIAWSASPHTDDRSPLLFDVGVPLGVFAIALLLLLARLVHAVSLVELRARELNGRRVELETALHRQQALQKLLSHQALHDPLTDLPNRTFLLRRLRETVHKGRGGTLAMIDLDDFKDVNDRFGHPAGDVMLVAVAGRLRASVPGGAMVARLGGDEFGVLLDGIPDREADDWATMLLARLREPVSVAGHELPTGASVGLRSIDARIETADLLRDADLAVYAAKAAGRNRFVRFDDGLRDRYLEKAHTLEELRAAISEGDFAVYYQPLVDLTDGRCVGLEALVRWTPKGKPLISPATFIPLAEDSGLIVPLGTWVLRRACQDAATWHQRYGVHVSVNVSARQLREPDFTTVVRQALQEFGLPSHALTLEITESVLVGDSQTAQATAQLDELRRAGVRVAVDDFGTGYSSLAYLRHLPIDSIKIDRAFVPAQTPPDEQQVALLRAIIDLAAGLRLDTVVEGVEVEQQAQLLRDLGGHLAQGYHYARPLPADATSRLLADSHGTHLVERTPMTVR